MQKPENSNRWKGSWKNIRKRRVNRWAFRVLIFMFFVALFADFIANDKPIYCKIEGKVYFPIFKQYGVDLGMSQWEPEFIRKLWNEHEYEQVLFPIIPYSARRLNSASTYLISPVGEQPVKGIRYRHWLGTDPIGRDVAAGMISGARMAMLVGLFSMFIASLIGVFFGALGGYFGDDQIRMSLVRLICNILGVILGWFYGFMVRFYDVFDSDAPFTGIIKGIGMVLIFIVAMNGIAYLLEKTKIGKRRLLLPVDIWVMRLIEVFDSIPLILVILALLSIVNKPSFWFVVGIIGFVRWTSIARFVRAEFLKIRQLEYIESARALGLNNWRIILRHALPNALSPVLITISFGIATSILIESTLSFLGLGLASDYVTWGSLLREARNNFSAWWLAIFPGLGIFVTVTAFNLIGEAYSEVFRRS